MPSTRDESPAPSRRRFGKDSSATSKRGLNRIPAWLTQDKGLPDWIAGSLVVVASGLLLTLAVWLLILVFPAK